MKVLKMKLLSKYGLFFFIGVLIISIIRVNFFYKKSIYNGNEKNFIVEVKQIKKSNKDTIYFKNTENLISYYEAFPYNVGDILKVKGELKKIKRNTIPNSFDYKNYLRSKGIYYELKISEVVLLKPNNSLLNKIINYIEKRIHSIGGHNEYLYAFILGNNGYFKDEVIEKYQVNGLIYLLVIGSLQMHLIVRLLEKLLKILKIEGLLEILFLAIIIIVYILLVNKVIGVLRSGLCFLIKKILKYLKISIDYSNIILLVASILLIINPFYCQNIGFQYSFIISYALRLVSKKITGNYFLKLLKISYVAFIVSLPISIYHNFSLNFLTIILSIIFVPLINFLLFPLCIITFIFPCIIPIFNFIVDLIEELNTFFYQIIPFYFNVRKPTYIVVLIYYLFIYLTYKNKKFYYVLISLFLIHLNINKFLNEKFVLFFDVNQGDAIIIKNRDNISLIDTGGSYNYKYSSDIIRYINSIGLSKINFLILSHGDYDHMGEAINLVNNFKVEKVIFNCGPYNDLEKELIKVLDKKKIKYYSCIKELNIDKSKLQFLQTKGYDNENDNSNVIYTELNGYKFMFMGDAGVTTEKEILNKYNLTDIDVLKVGHHGSKTSSSKEFISEINPRYSIISVGKNNRYGHPNKETLDNLENSKIYRTDEDGSIMFKIKNNRLKIDTCSP